MAFDHKPFIETLTTKPGVYCMLDEAGELLYVGKARNLKNRVSSYFSKSAKSMRITQMVSKIARIEVTVARSEDEALVLEYELIKTRKPRYNISFRDDKSYPWLRFSSSATPRISLHRGKQHENERYFGPYPSASAVRDTIGTIQRTFQLRTCRDGDFANRSRPCLLHQIKRCSAPCTGVIPTKQYQSDVQAAIDVLSGRGEVVVKSLQNQMQKESEQLNFEMAAELRDRIAALRRLQESRVVSDARGDFDLVCVANHHGLSGIGLMPVRGGRSLGSRSFYPRNSAQADDSEVLRSFVQHHYLNQRPPPEIILSEAIDDESTLAKILSTPGDLKVRLHSSTLRGNRKRLQEMTAESLHASLIARLSERETVEGRYLALQERLGLDEPITRMECFDISHTRGEGTRASCVVFGAAGPDKPQYRRFAIENITPGDDYAAINQAVSRRYTRIARNEIPAPDLLFIDGGKGQVTAAVRALMDLQMDDSVVLVGISKGPERRAGEEELHFPGQSEPMILNVADPALHLIQQIRDEAHRFALAGHRGQRARTRTQSTLEEVGGLGAKRRSALLREFGGIAQVRRASVDDLAQVPGISRKLAQRLYDHLHDTD